MTDSAKLVLTVPFLRPAVQSDVKFVQLATNQMGATHSVFLVVRELQDETDCVKPAHLVVLLQMMVRRTAPPAQSDMEIPETRQYVLHVLLVKAQVLVRCVRSVHLATSLMLEDSVIHVQKIWDGLIPVIHATHARQELARYGAGHVLVALKGPYLGREDLVLPARMVTAMTLLGLNVSSVPQGRIQWMEHPAKSAKMVLSRQALEQIVAWRAQQDSHPIMITQNVNHAKLDFLPKKGADARNASPEALLMPVDSAKNVLLALETPRSQESVENAQHTPLQAKVLHALRVLKERIL